MKDDLTDKMATKFVFDGRPVAIKVSFTSLKLALPFVYAVC